MSTSRHFTAQRYLAVPRAFKTAQYRQQKTTVRASALAREGTVLVTREQGKNNALIDSLSAIGISTLELPLIVSVPGPDVSKLPEVLRERSFDYVALTSPEAADVFLQGWREAGQPEVRIATVGKGTTRILSDAPEAAQVQAAFVPSKANAVHLIAELPVLESGTQQVLYPASLKAATTLQDGLAKRGFDVQRLNTYDTLPVSADSIHEAMLDFARQCSVVSIASPSALKAWIGLVGLDTARTIPVACIGSTSGNAALKAGLDASLVFWDEDPGMDGFVRSVRAAMQPGLPVDSSGRNVEGVPS